MRDEFDVIAVRLDILKVRVMARGKSKRNAVATADMAVARRGVDEEFYTIVDAGRCHDGDTWIGEV